MICLTIFRHRAFAFQNQCCVCYLNGPEDLLYSKRESLGYGPCPENKLLFRGKKEISLPEKIIKEDKINLHLDDIPKLNLFNILAAWSCSGLLSLVTEGLDSNY